MDTTTTKTSATLLVCPVCGFVRRADPPKGFCPEAWAHPGGRTVPTVTGTTKTTCEDGRVQLEPVEATW